ncbi:MAG TPA: beta-ketoacyl-[acyl-carrier-protein] synthase family protein [Thermoanaerobaculia bacterium]|nr:beta-ketoacyl-[acyl-carrier-protein] synthase family protein [Thermoanaerobaculia bacterium]
MTTRVAITGIGIISCVGRGRDAATEAVRSGKSGIRPITNIDASALQCRMAGEVLASDLGDSEFKQHDRFTRFALIAASEAAEQAGVPASSVPDHRVGTLIGTGLGGCETLDAAYKRIYAGNQARVVPMTIPNTMYNAATSAVATHFRARGPSLTTVSACSSSAHAIGQAAHWIRNGLADMMFAGGADAPLCFGVIRAWESMRVLAVDNEQPTRACRPFSADRRGLVLAEGAAVLVLESFESAESRSREILGEICGFGLTSDAGHITDPSPDGAARAMEMAIHDAGITPSSVGYINAHGTATKANDVAETEAIKRLFGDQASAIPVSSTKSMHGHAMGASGAIEIALSLEALNRDFIPPTINLEKPDPLCDLDYVPNVARTGTARFFLSNSFGFGGMNAVIAVRTRAGM